MNAGMTAMLRNGLIAAACLLAAACGGNNLSSGSTPVGPTNNVAALVIDGGPGGDAVNTLYTSVKVCVPNSSTCQTIDHIQVDTGSSGLRLLSQAVSLSLPVTAAANGNALVECMVFVDGYSWGPVSSVDLTVAGETASGVPVQLIGDPRYPTVAADCASAGGNAAEDTVAAFGANGIIGISYLVQDCGPTCVSQIVPAFYYACTAAACAGSTVALNSQVVNPISLFETDNNGSIISIPTVDVNGGAGITGSLIFGIDTESNNQSGTVTVLTLAPDSGYLTTTYNGVPLTHSYIDSGSNATYFNDTSIVQCSDSGFAGFYCPASTLSLTATLEGANGTTIAGAFSVTNAEMLNGAFQAFPGLAGTNPDAQSFDWGLPFFYGKRVSNALVGASTAVGTGPYVAF